MDCPRCGAKDMLFFKGEIYPEDGYVEPDLYQCPDCGHDVVMPRATE